MTASSTEALREKNGISVERQFELMQKYGVSEADLEIIRNNSVGRDEAVNKFLTNLTNRYLHNQIEAADIMDVSILIPERFRGANPEDPMHH